MAETFCRHTESHELEMSWVNPKSGYQTTGPCCHPCADALWGNLAKFPSAIETVTITPIQKKRHAHRVQLRRTKGWRMPPNTVSVARPTKWGNPVRSGDDISYYLDGVTAATADDAAQMFRMLMEAHEGADPEKFEAALAPLRGKNLACWCPLDQPCHADVLLELANRNGGAS